MNASSQQPDGIIITISQQMLKEKGYKNWLSNFMLAMSQHEQGWTYWMRLGAKPTKDKDLQYVYLCIGGKIRFRCYYGGSEGPMEKDFGNWSGEGPKKIFARAWVILSGPVERPPAPITMSGFRGFRYCLKLW